MTTETPGAALKRYLGDHELKYEEAGKQLRVSRQTIWSWIKGESIPGEAAKAAIAEFTAGEIPASAWPVVDRRKPEEPAA